MLNVQQESGSVSFNIQSDTPYKANWLIDNPTADESFESALQLIVRKERADHLNEVFDDYAYNNQSIYRALDFDEARNNFIEEYMESDEYTQFELELNNRLNTLRFFQESYGDPYIKVRDKGQKGYGGYPNRAAYKATFDQSPLMPFATFVNPFTKEDTGISAQLWEPEVSDTMYVFEHQVLDDMLAEYPHTVQYESCLLYTSDAADE